MNSMSLAHAKAHLSELLNTVESGEEVLITRHGRPVAKMVPVSPVKHAMPLKRLAALRQQVPSWTINSVQSLQELRDEE